MAQHTYLTINVPNDFQKNLLPDYDDRTTFYEKYSKREKIENNIESQIILYWNEDWIVDYFYIRILGFNNNTNNRIPHTKKDILKFIKFLNINLTNKINDEKNNIQVKYNNSDYDRMIYTLCILEGFIHAFPEDQIFYYQAVN